MLLVDADTVGVVPVFIDDNPYRYLNFASNPGWAMVRVIILVVLNESE